MSVEEPLPLREALHLQKRGCALQDLCWNSPWVSSQCKKPNGSPYMAWTLQKGPLEMGKRGESMEGACKGGFSTSGLQLDA
jgi:hypothetical protein